jgi:acetyl esterase/lipase
MNGEKVTYAERAGGPLSLNILRPSGGLDRSTAVLHLHGGGWRMGLPEMLTPRSLALTSLGYTVVQVQYRLLTDEVRWPAPMVDLRSALRWVWTHADELGVRRDRIVLWGHSAGAHISLMTAGTRNQESLNDPTDDSSVPVSIAAVVACYPPAEFYAGDVPLVVPGPDGLPDLAAIAANQRSDGSLPGIDLLAEPCTDEQALAISPVHQIDSNFPPTMIVHGTADTMILPASSDRLASTLKNIGVTSQLVTFADCNHEFDMIPSYTTVLTAHIDLFIRRVLGDPTLAEEIAANAMFPERAESASSPVGT